MISRNVIHSRTCLDSESDIGFNGYTKQKYDILMIVGNIMWNIIRGCHVTLINILFCNCYHSSRVFFFNFFFEILAPDQPPKLFWRKPLHGFQNCCIWCIKPLSVYPKRWIILYMFPCFGFFPEIALGDGLEKWHIFLFSAANLPSYWHMPFQISIIRTPNWHSICTYNFHLL